MIAAGFIKDQDGSGGEQLRVPRGAVIDSLMKKCGSIRRQE
jgi:hypothetical protein